MKEAEQYNMLPIGDRTLERFVEYNTRNLWLFQSTKALMLVKMELRRLLRTMEFHIRINLWKDRQSYR
ncbi:MAG: hypothetical protein ABSB79_07865 [Syntrophales bacterium]